jgi:RNA polymerase sigma-70 factor (ECF subfamily)
MKEGQDERSWDEFLCIYRPYIQTIIRNMNISDSDADDIIQQVWIRLWKHLETYSPEKRFRNWLSAITANCVKDFMRKRTLNADLLEKAARDETLLYLQAIRLPEINQIAEREWGIYLTHLALERVAELFSGKAIEVFMMSLEGLEIAEIAQKMELKENSVYRLKNRVKKQVALEIGQLRQELG